MKNKALKYTSALIAVLIIFSALSIGMTAFTAAEYNVGDTVVFGSYPQSKVTDENIISSLNQLLSDDDFTDKKYYIGDGTVGSQKLESYYFVADKYFNGEKYRAVRFTKYRPTATHYPCPSESSNQYTNIGYFKDNVYWFKYDPIVWKILDPASGLAVSDRLIDSQAFDNENFNPESFESSTICSFLNNEFYNTAFEENEKEAINSADNKIRLLTSSDAVNSAYGFDSNSSRDDVLRRPVITEYTAINGSVPVTYSGIRSANWLLGDIAGEGKVNICYFYGALNKADSTAVRGIRPVINLDLNSADKFTVIYKNDGEVIRADSYTEGESIETFTPDIPGYNFIGWDIALPDKMPAHNITVNAISEIKTYTLKLDANGGVFAGGSDTIEKPVTYGSALNIETPEKQGYVFNGWDAEIPDIMPAHDITAKAIWAEAENTPYKVIIHKEKITSGYDTEEITLYGRTDSEITYSPAEEEGFEVDSDKSDLTGTISPGGDTVLNIYYRRLSYLVTFDFNNNTAKEYLMYKHGQSLNPPIIPEREGYAGKWVPDIPDVCTGSEVYKVSWEKNKYQISFDTDGGTFINNALYEYGDAVEQPEAPEKEGYKFIGWDSEIPDTMPAENLTVKALWEISEYKVTWNINGRITEETLEYGSPITPPEVIAPEGYVFISWGIPVPENMPAGDLAFTAQFERAEYTLTWIIDGSVIKTENLNFNDEITEPEATERNGYSFAWSEHPSAMPSHDLTINGSYTKIPDQNDIPYIKIRNYQQERTVDYKTTITFRAVTNAKSGNNIKWYINDEYKGNGQKFTVSKAASSFTVKCVTQDENGNSITSQTQTVKVKTCFWAKLIAFFRMIFRRLPVIEQ